MHKLWITFADLLIYCLNYTQKSVEKVYKHELSTQFHKAIHRRNLFPAADRRQPALNFQKLHLKRLQFDGKTAIINGQKRAAPADRRKKQSAAPAQKSKIIFSEDTTMAKITADTLIMDCLKLNPDSAEILMSYGMHCLGCAMAHGETIGEAVSVHGNDLEELLEKLNAGVQE